MAVVAFAVVCLSFRVCDCGWGMQWLCLWLSVGDGVCGWVFVVGCLRLRVCDCV